VLDGDGRGAQLGARLREARQTAGLSQQELASRSGVNLDTLRAIEQGRTQNPGIFTVRQLALRLGVGLDELAAD